MDKEVIIKNCKFCQNKIYLNEDKYILLGTYTGKEINDESYFHFVCFHAWYNKQVSEKAKNTIKGFQEKAKSLFSDLSESGMLSNIAGITHLKSLLGKELGEFKGGMPNISEMFGDLEKNNNDRAKQPNSKREQ